MGLDNFAVYGSEHPKYDHTEGASIPDDLFPDNRLCGGLFSGGGNSFRGKVYNDIVEFFTNYSLYSDELTPDQVKDIYLMLCQVTEDRFLREYVAEGMNTWEVEYRELKDLTEWFGVVVSEGGSVISWY
jgi:hypothetical protein